MVDKILVVEDQIKYKDILKNYLRDYELYIVDNCDDAKKVLLEHQDIRLAIVNMNLEQREVGYPNDQRGLDVLEMIQKEYSSLPRVVLTGEPQNLNKPIEIFVPLGVNEVFYKALIYDKTGLLDIVKRYIISPNPEDKRTSSDSKEKEGIVFKGAVKQVVIQQTQNGDNQMEKKEKVIEIGANAQISGSVVIAESIKDSFNIIEKADIQDDLKEQLKQLAQAVQTMIQAMPKEQAEEAADAMQVLVKEAAKPAPRKEWYSVSIEGLTKAAQNWGKVGAPVIALAAKVLALLAGGG